MNNTINLFQKILERNPTEEEIRRYSNKTYAEILNDLSFCKEKLNLLRQKSGDYVKTKVEYSNQDIQDFFSCKDLKVALCLSGHIRNYSANLSSIEKYLVKPLNADVFIHSWDTLGPQKFLTKDGIGPSPDESTKYNEDILNILSNIKSKKIENNSEYLSNIEKKLINNNFYLFGKLKFEKTFEGQSEPKYIYSQFYSIYNSYKLLEEYSIKNQIKYDIVIKLRTDYCLTSGIFYEDLTEVQNSNCYFIPNTPYSSHGHPSCCLCKNDIDHCNLGHIEDVCDVFAYSSQTNMKKYMCVYEELENINQNFNTLNEKLLKYNNINIQNRDNYKIVDLWRENGYLINCFYPERIFRSYLKDNLLKPSRLSGNVLRK